MVRDLTNRIILIVFVLALALWVDLSNEIELPNPFSENEVLFQRDVKPRLGLDLQGGLQVLLEADLPAEIEVTSDSMDTARDIVENRTNALGVSENLIQVAGDRRIVGEFPGAEDADAILDIIQQTGLLEFVDTGDFTPEDGAVLQTDFLPGDETLNPDDLESPAIYHTIMTGKELQSVNVGVDQFGKPAIDFTLSAEGTTIFAEFTANNIGKTLAIVLDKTVVSAPRIEGSIPGGQGQITGNFTVDSANALAVQLRYGSLPIPLKVVETRIIGPTLGEDSLQKSLIAGSVGMVIVMLFMGIYYRLPGIVADLAIIMYAVIAFAVFKYFHFTLTLPGIAGFLLSTGAALDANILIFERIKEELRNGRSLSQSVDQGWTRAWPSIWESNVTTIITSLILYWFGSQFGATIVKGFSLTLALGVGISLFSAIFITRSLLAIFLQSFKPTNLARWFGI